MGGILVRIDESAEGVEYNNLKTQIVNSCNTQTSQIKRVIQIEGGWSGDDVVAVDAFRTQLKADLLVMADLADPLT